MKDALNDPPRPSWQQHDFVDTDSATPSEEDPWEPQHHTPVGALPTDADCSEPSDATLRAYADTVNESADGVSVDSGDLLLLEDLDDAEALDDLSVDDIEFGGPAGPQGPPGMDGAFDEPQPDRLPASVLRDDLYPPDESINDLTLALKLDSFFEPLALDNAEIDACRQILESDSYKIRIRRFLPWLAKQLWPAGRLLLFLEFRRIWESRNNVRWWECHYKSHPLYDFHALTWNATYDLIRCRSHCRHTEVIEEAWFREWEDFEIWHHGIKSFASFAVLRSSIPEGECWQDHVFRCDRRSHAELMECSDPTYAPFSLFSIIRQYRLSPIVETDFPIRVESDLQLSRPELEWADWEIELCKRR